MFKVYVNPEDVWDYFHKHKTRLGNELDVIAEFETDDGDIPLKVYLTEECGLPFLTIESDEDEEVIEKEGAVSRSDCKSVAERLYATLEDFVSEENDEYTDLKELDDCDFEIVSEREQEILEALKKFILVLMGCDADEETEFDDGTLLEMLSYIEEIVFECGYVPYHPQIYEDENGIPKLITSLYEDEEMM